MNRKTLWITQTACMIALLIVLQATTAVLGNTMITGTVVNLILILSCMGCGFSSSLTVSIVSPIIAKILGIGPLWSIIPFIILGNIALVSVWNWFRKRKTINRRFADILATITSAFIKFIVLYLGIVKLAIPVFLNLPEKQSVAISALFSLPQFFTAIFGGAIAVAVLPILNKGLQSFASHYSKE